MGKTISPSEVDFNSFKAYRYEYKWSILNFKKLAATYAPGYRTESEYINCILKDKTKSFHLILYPHGYNERTENYVSVYLKKYDEADEILIQFTLSILDIENQKSNVKSIKKKMSIESHLGWMLFCRRDFLLDDENSFLTDENLNLNCTIEIFENKAIPMAETEEDINLSLSKMSYDMSKLLSEGQFSDVIFRVDEVDFKVHKAILSARSSVFKTMMKSQLKGDSRVVNISDITVDAIKEMLLYIYCGDVRCTDVQLTQELYYAADKYDLQDLKNVCNKILVSYLAINNAIDLLLLGHMHSDNDLKYASIDFIAKYISEIQETQEWISLLKNHPELANTVLKKHLKKKV